MEVEKYMRGSVTVVALHGELESGTAARAQVGLGEVVPTEGGLLIDMGELSFISSAGLRVLLLVYRQARDAGVRLAMAGLRPEVAEVMAATGFLSFFTVADTVDEAVEELGG